MKNISIDVEPRNLEKSLFKLPNESTYMQMSTRDRLLFKYEDYELRGLSIYCVTLSTYIKSEKFATSDRMSHFWNNDFMPRVLRYVPCKYKQKVDHDYIIERAPNYCYHYHGLIAMPTEAAGKIWINGALNRNLVGNLESFQTVGTYRSFRINNFLIEPAGARGLGSSLNWVKYITKSNTFIDGSN